MNNITLNDLLNIIQNYSINQINMIKKAYLYAKELHSNQFRESGEPYIIHPLNVAYILASMNADSDTICAGLLHDTLEDTSINKEDIIENFNYSIASLVDGVTKLTRNSFDSTKSYNLANERKIIMGITKDVRIIIIKLADRLHNMRTLEFKSKLKQIENSIETMKLFVPISYCIGAYSIKSELENISFKYLNYDMYSRINERRNILKDKNNLNGILLEMNNDLNYNNISNFITSKIKSVYTIYKKLELGIDINNIYDLFSLKILVNEISDCYKVVDIINNNYQVLNNCFKDYIYAPKSNKYSAIHTTICSDYNMYTGIRVATTNMDKINSLGIIAYYKMYNNKAKETMEMDLRNKYEFYNQLLKFDQLYKDDKQFIYNVKNRVLIK